MLGWRIGRCMVKEVGGADITSANTGAKGEKLMADAHLMPRVAMGKVVREYVRTGWSAAVTVSSLGWAVLK